MLRPYLDAGVLALGSALAAGLTVGAIDAAMASGPGASFLALLGPTLALYALPALFLGLAGAAIGGAVVATFGPGAPGRLLDRLRQDRALDRDVTAAILAAGVALVVITGLVAMLSLKLVAGVERKAVGAMLAGAATAVAIPLVAAASLPLYRLARAPARLVPRLGPLPGCLVLVIAVGLVAALGAASYVGKKLDWRALNLGGHAFLAGLAALTAILAALARGPLSALLARIPRRGAVASAGAVIALVLVPLTLRGQPAPEVSAALAEHSGGARILVALGRGLLDADGDGYSAFLGGPDCDDTRADVNPDAAEVPDNGIDDNCLGGDRSSAAQAADGPAAARPTPAAPVQKRADNVILVIIDTLRADRLGAAGYRRDGKSLTPNLDRLAAHSAHFTHAYAHAPNTPRSFPSIFTSRYPSQVKVDKVFANYSNPLDDNTTLFEALTTGGLTTTGVASHFYFERAPGIRQGFASFDNQGALDIAGSNKDSAAPRILPRVQARLGELAASKQRFALFVHLFEPHSTYMEHAEFPVTEGGVAGLEQKYDFEIAYVDQFIGQLLDAIDAHQLGDHTMLVVMSDHGEAFGSHRVAGQKMFFHGQTLYDELLRVPLFVRLPGVAPAVIDDPVGLIDVAPTILDGMGIAKPPDMTGRSVLPRALGQPLPPRPIFAQLLPAPSWDHKWMAMVTGDGKHKLIYRVSDRAFELYDLAADPGEKVNLYEKQPELAAQLRDELTRWIEVDLAL